MKTLFFVLLFFFISTPSIFADSYDYFSPVEVGNNPQRSPPSTVNNPESKDPSVYSNDIDTAPITCSYQVNISQTTAPDQVLVDSANNIWKWVKTLITSLSEEKNNQTYTNNVFRDSQLHLAKDPVIKLEATDQERGTQFKNYDKDGRNASIRSQPYAYQLVNKGQLIEDAALSLNNAKDTVVTDEALAWNCSGTCRDLFDENGNKPSGCQPITISEVGYYYYKNGKSTSYELVENQAINISFPGSVSAIFNNYSHYRTAFHSLASTPNCYETLYKNLPLVPRGSINTKHVFHNINESGNSVDSVAYQAVPLAASLASNQASTTLNLAIPQKQPIHNISSSFCNNIKTASPIADKPSRFNILTFVRNLIIYIEQPQDLNTQVNTDMILPAKLTDNMNKDLVFLNDFIPKKSQDNYKAEKLSTTDNNSDTNTPNPGSLNDAARVYFKDIIIPKNWQDIYNPRPQEPSYPTSTGNVPKPVKAWCPIIKKYADINDLPSGLIAAVMTIESGGDPNSISYQGAVGLMQVMPSDGIAAKFMCNGQPCFAGRPTTQQLLDPDFNVSYATNLLKNLINYWGSIRDGLLHYGPVNYGYKYADDVLGIYNANKNICQ